MKIRHLVFIPVITILTASSVFGQNVTVKPATPHASPEAKALLQLIYNLSGKYTLTGQHNFPAAGDRNSKFAAGYTGKPPVIWSTDFGFAKEGDKDSYRKRRAMVEEAERQNKMGSLITLCWHAVPPTASEPVTFQPVAGADPNALASVQGRLTDEQFKDVLTPGTALYKNWAAQVDTIAFYLKELQKRHIAVLWRPYHEMNGNWFWWAGRPGQNGSAALYRQIYDRFVNVHHLDNLLWVWNVNAPNPGWPPLAAYYPGAQYADLVTMDIYGEFKQEYYTNMLALAAGKPIALAEVGKLPTPEVLEKQPRWAYFMAWSEFIQVHNPPELVNAVYHAPQVLTRDDPRLVAPLAAIRNLTNRPITAAPLVATPALAH